MESAWQTSTGDPIGHLLAGDLTWESAQYCAGYMLKKLTVSKASSEADQRAWEQRYQRVDADTGEIIEITPEYSTSSNRPGIGASWFERYYTDIFPSDSVVIDGNELPVPRYYEKLLEVKDPGLYQEVKLKRIAERNRKDDSPMRLEAMEKCAIARTQFFGGRNDSADLQH